MSAERRQVGGEALLIADVCEHSAEAGEPRRLLSRNGQARFGHHNSQAQGFHGRRLATSVGARAGTGNEGRERVMSGLSRGGRILGQDGHPPWPSRK